MSKELEDFCTHIAAAKHLIETFQRLPLCIRDSTLVPYISDESFLPGELFHRDDKVEVNTDNSNIQSVETPIRDISHRQVDTTHSNNNSSLSTVKPTAQNKPNAKVWCTASEAINILTERIQGWERQCNTIKSKFDVSPHLPIQSNTLNLNATTKTEQLIDVKYQKGPLIKSDRANTSQRDISIDDNAIATPLSFTSSGTINSSMIQHTPSVKDSKRKEQGEVFMNEHDGTLEIRETYKGPENPAFYPSSQENMSNTQESSVSSSTENSHNATAAWPYNHLFATNRIQPKQPQMNDRNADLSTEKSQLSNLSPELENYLNELEIKEREAGAAAWEDNSGTSLPISDNSPVLSSNKKVNTPKTKIAPTTLQGTGWMKGFFNKSNRRSRNVGASTSATSSTMETDSSTAAVASISTSAISSTIEIGTRTAETGSRIMTSTNVTSTTSATVSSSIAASAPDTVSERTYSSESVVDPSDKDTMMQIEHDQSNNSISKHINVYSSPSHSNIQSTTQMQTVVNYTNDSFEFETLQHNNASYNEMTVCKQQNKSPKSVHWGDNEVLQSRQATYDPKHTSNDLPQSVLKQTIIPEPPISSTELPNESIQYPQRILQNMSNQTAFGNTIVERMPPIKNIQQNDKIQLSSNEDENVSSVNFQSKNIAPTKRLSKFKHRRMRSSLH